MMNKAVRKITNTRSLKVISRMSIPQAGVSLLAESQIERDAYMLLSMFPNIERIEAQPCEVRYWK
jgi:hypothetical protein